MITTVHTAGLAVMSAALVLVGSTAAVATTEPPQSTASGDAEFEAACVFVDALPSANDADDLRSDEWAFGEPNMYRLLAAANGFQAAGAADPAYAAVAEHAQRADGALRVLRYDELEVHLGALHAACSDGPGEPSAAPADLPGGSAGAEILDEAAILDDGVIRFGPAFPDAPGLDEALCAYLFGTPNEVGDVARLDGEVTLEDDSGYHQLGGGGDGVRCNYAVDGVWTLALRLWSQPPEFDEGDPAPVAQVEFGGWTGWGIYASEYDGEQIDEATLTQWLTEASGRFGGGGV